MNRIGQRLANLKAENRKALVTYIVNGDPRPDVSLAAMHALVEAGADIIELGVPFSDPMAEGPVIQRGHERALEHGTSLKGTMNLVKAFRETNQETPVVLMGYANPVERMGYEAFASQASDAGVDGLLTVDLPAEEAEALNVQLRKHNIENIFLLAPTTTDSRVERVVSLAGGFLYYVSLKGVTGAGNLDVDAVNARLNTIKQKTDLPVLVGFGIKDAASASAIGAIADGVVVGSVLVDAMGKNEQAGNDDILAALKAILTPMRQALDSL
ncbi:Tryptophan synthase alpha chain [Thalassocella blandensis]|nr:Tryptophan synthase alpha chain [Thalassocella blandensis]